MRMKTRHRPSYYPMGVDPYMTPIMPPPRTIDELRDCIELYQDMLEAFEKKDKEKKPDPNKKPEARKFNFLEVLGLLFPAYFLFTLAFKAAGISPIP